MTRNDPNAPKPKAKKAKAEKSRPAKASAKKSLAENKPVKSKALRQTAPAEQEPLARSCQEVQSRLSAFADGMLAVSEQKRVQDHLERCPECLDTYGGLRSLQGVLNKLRQEEVLDSHAIWKRLMHKLEEDQANNTPCTFNATFISTYYDRELREEELNREEPFESHLPACPPCNHTLAEISEASETVRQFGFRMEKNCGLDVTKLISHQLQQEAADPQKELAATKQPPERLLHNSQYSVETLSAYFDGELPAKEALAVGKLLESDDDCCETVQEFGRLSEALARTHERIMSEAPDCWGAMQAEVLESLKVVHLETRRQQRQSTMIRRLSAIAAGVALLVATVSMVVKPAGASLASRMENTFKNTLENTLAYNAPSSEEYLFQTVSTVPAAEEVGWVVNHMAP